MLSDDNKKWIVPKGETIRAQMSQQYQADVDRGRFEVVINKIPLDIDTVQGEEISVTFQLRTFPKKIWVALYPYAQDAAYLFLNSPCQHSDASKHINDIVQLLHEGGFVAKRFDCLESLQKALDCLTKPKIATRTGLDATTTTTNNESDIRYVCVIADYGNALSCPKRLLALDGSCHNMPCLSCIIHSTDRRKRNEDLFNTLLPTSIVVGEETDSIETSCKQIICGTAYDAINYCFFRNNVDIGNSDTNKNRVKKPSKPWEYSREKVHEHIQTVLDKLLETKPNDQTEQEMFKEWTTKSTELMDCWMKEVRSAGQTGDYFGQTPQPPHSWQPNKDIFPNYKSFLVRNEEGSRNRHFFKKAIDKGIYRYV